MLTLELQDQRIFKAMDLCCNNFFHHNSVIVVPNANQSLVPIRPNDGCPKGTIDGITTCFCEDHCSWNVCRLKHPPINCPMVMSWRWYSEGMHWMAQSNFVLSY